MAEVVRGEDMGGVIEVNNPPGTSWLRFTNALCDQNIPVPTSDLAELKQDDPLVGDFYIAGVNYMAQNQRELGIKLLRYVSNLGDI